MGRRTWLIVAGVAALLLAMYALAGFLWVPRLVQSSVLETVERDFGRKAEFARPRFNPFTFEFDAGAFSVPDADGTRLLGFDRLYFDFELSSLWRRAWTFGAIRIEQPYLKLVQRADGSLNLVDLQKPAAAPSGRPQTSRDPGVPAFAIGALTVTGGEVDVEDRTRAERFATTLRPVTFELVDFRSAGEGNAFSFSAGSDRAGRVAVNGTLGIGPFSSKGKIALSGLPATTVSEYLGELLPVSLRDGRIELRIAYEFSLAGQPFTLVLESPSVSARGLVTVARGYDVAWQIPALDVRDTRVDLAARTVRVGAIELRDVVAPAWIDERGFHAPGALPQAEAAPATTPAAVAGSPASAGPAWKIEAPEIRVANAAIVFEDRRVKPAAALGFSVRELSVGALAIPQGGPLSIAGTVTFESGGDLALLGAIEQDPLRLAVELTTTTLDLKALQPWLAQGTDLELRSGRLTSKGRVEYAAKGRPRLRYAGNVTVAGLHTQDRALGEDFVNWSSLELRKLEFTHEPARLEIREILAKDPYLRLILAANGVTNVKSVLDPEGAARLAAEIAAERAGQERKKESRRSRRKEAESTGAPEELLAAPRLPARIGTIRIANGNLNFSDYTLQPPFQIAVERLGGTITGMTSVAGEHARVELAGEVDRYAPARIDGELNLLAAQSYVDLAATFRNLELTSFNPYSSKFAGYRIDKGKLSIETNYRVENRMLDARHKFTLEQLQLGDRVESPDAVSLPLRLAVALLKDRNGVIDIDLPVTGSLDDPEFRLGPLIWKALLNLLGKIVTSPFALLGNLFGGGEDLSDLPFTPGSAAMEPASAEKIAALRKALVERPGLSIDIPSTLDPQADRDALEQRRWFLLIGGDAVAASPAASAQVAALRTNRKTYRDRLIELHRELLGGRPDIPPAPRPDADAPEPDPVEHAIAYLEPRLRATVAVDEAELAALAQARAESVRDALLTEAAVDPARVFLIRGEPVTATDGAVRMALRLK